MKFRGLSEYFGRPVHAYVNRSPNHLSVGFLRLVPAIAEAFESPDAPYDVRKELPPNHQDLRWSSLEGCRDWAGFDFVAVANGHLEMGHRIETWWPEIETDYTYPLRIPAATVANMASAAQRVLIYLSGKGPNFGFHRNTWTVHHWADVIKGLNSDGIEPMLVGAKTRDDLSYRDLFLQVAGGLRFEDRVGSTALDEYCEIIRTARCWVGLNSGGGIVAAMQSTPTVMLWSDSRYPIAGVRDINLPLNHTMQTSWLSPEQQRSYRSLSFGSPDLTPTAVLRAIGEVIR
jgi:ADP-heptose:LPS heptosyltransferase